MGFSRQTELAAYESSCRLLLSTPEPLTHPAVLQIVDDLLYAILPD